MTYGKPFDREKSRAMMVLGIQRRIVVEGLAEDIMDSMVAEFVSTVDMEKCAEQLQFDDSYTTLHDHRLGDEILNQTDLVHKLESFAGAGRFADLLGGSDDACSGTAMAQISDSLASTLESFFKRGKFRPLLVRSLSLKLKSSEWWKSNQDRVSRILQKNRSQLNKVREVQES